MWTGQPITCGVAAEEGALCDADAQQHRVGGHPRQRSSTAAALLQNHPIRSRPSAACWHSKHARVILHASLTQLC